MVTCAFRFRDTGVWQIALCKPVSSYLGTGSLILTFHRMRGLRSLLGLWLCELTYHPKAESRRKWPVHTET